MERYFTASQRKPFAFQKQSWRAYQAGQSGLIHSATGTGKTLAVWMGPILSWLMQNRDQRLWDAKKPPGPRVIWVTPLRALAGDTENSLRQPLDFLGLPWRLESRTGDSKQSLKAKQLKQLPTALITTPESLSLMLTHEHLQQQLSGLESVIVDEWHELLGTKRGVQTELVLARLRRLNPQLRVWGLSATLGNLHQALESLVGVGGIETDKDSQRSATIISGVKRKRVVFQSLLPEVIERFPWSGHIGTRMVPQVANLIDSVSSTLIFANTRSQTEIWYQELLKHRPNWAGQIALHHGSLDTSVRTWVENGLRGGTLKAVVCTSSLDLGVDFTAVDLVVQIGSPKGSARLLQRAGRSGHQPGAESRLVFVPTHSLELVELAAAQDAIASGNLESRALLNKPLDVLVQHAATLSLGGGFQSEDLLSEVRTARCYENLSDGEWRWVLDFIVRGGGTLEAYPEFHRVEVTDTMRYVMTDKRISRMHRMNIGTIVSDAAMMVKYMKGGNLGTVEESFLSRLKPGEKFLFAGRVVELVIIRDNVAYVRRAKGTPDTVPRWMGGRMPLSSELSQSLRLKLQEASEGHYVGAEMRALKPLLELQKRWSELPRRDELLIERVKTREGHHLFVYPFAGRLAHEGLAAVISYRISRILPITFAIACNDYGIVLHSRQEAPLEKAIASGLFDGESLVRDILACLNATEMSKRQFRQIARVAGLINQGLPGDRKPSKHLQASSNLFYDVFRQYDPSNRLLLQSDQEVLDFQLEISRLTDVLMRIETRSIILTKPPKVTPLAFPLYVDRLRERVSSETLAQRIRAMTAGLDTQADQSTK
ncbi:MAG TPA: ligase-associated DNA damage response DEXH box helicase [Planctomycetaceae bacterium]|nr:ligase-associated DNA damage response DEXH box helicase [Planctomycetaceae bacterium]